VNNISTELPPYLGMGLLDAESITYKNSKLTANYFLEEELIYQVTLSDGDCLLTEYFERQKIAESRYASLEAAFMSGMMAFPACENRRLVKLYNQITNERNIYARFAGERSAIFFPAGYIFILRQPIPACKLANWERLKALVVEEPDSPVHFSAEHNGAVFRQLRSGNVEVEGLKIADCSATWRNLAAATDLLWESQLVPPEKEYRLTVMDCSESSGFSIDLGHAESDTATFSVQITDDLENESYERAIRFVRLSKELEAEWGHSPFQVQGVM
jgi:hypothetical protein